jgi:type I restriction enzyme, S subunit
MSQLASRTYERHACITFRKTSERFGGLSNMAPGFPLRVNGVLIRTSEALYQACRFPHRPDIQRLIIEQTSPMTAKMKSKPHRKQSRLDWERVRVKIMTWCLRVKLAQHWHSFGDLLLATGDLPIVEESAKDDFWGAKAVDAERLEGKNVLGRLLMKLRAEFRGPHPELLRHVEPPAIPNFFLLGQPIANVGMPFAHRGSHESMDREGVKSPQEREVTLPPIKHAARQGDLLSSLEVSAVSSYRDGRASSVDDASLGSFPEGRRDELLISSQVPDQGHQSIPLTFSSAPPYRLDVVPGEVVVSRSLNPANPRELDVLCQLLRERVISLETDQAKIELVIYRIK